MRIYIVGAPGVGKTLLAAKVKDAVSHMHIYSTPQGDDYPALGAQTDYRTEVALAVDRMRSSMQDDDLIYTGSLIDNVAHVATNYAQMSSLLQDDELALRLMTSHVIAAMLRDSLKSDFIFFKPGHTDEYSSLIEQALLAVLESFSVSYVELTDDDDENAKLIAGLIYGENVGQSNDS